jgi:hypothetical protein
MNGLCFITYACVTFSIENEWPVHYHLYVCDIFIYNLYQFFICGHYYYLWSLLLFVLIIIYIRVHDLCVHYYLYTCTRSLCVHYYLYTYTRSLCLY